MIPQSEIDRVVAQTGMGELQARRHLEALSSLQSRGLGIERRYHADPAFRAHVDGQQAAFEAEYSAWHQHFDNHRSAQLGAVWEKSA